MDKDQLIEALDQYFRSENGQAAIRDGAIRAWHFIRQDTRGMIDMISTLESGRFVLDHIPLHLGKSHADLRRDAILAAPEEGLFLEFGVFQAHWINKFASYRESVQFFGFDSFEGLPEAWSTMSAATFSLNGVLPQVASNVSLVKGWFSDSLPGFLTEHPEPISFIHIDCDLYSSTIEVLDLLKPRLRVGTQIVMDDFMLMPDWQNQEHKAFFDFVRREGIEFDYTGYSNEYPGCSASVVLTKV